ncbi:MAG: cytochrome b/b6 domain-containing protein [Chloroflexi bacterium]|nr:cytochrome b/b6 domain-containing protein [Chloroflexota bacterium]
MTTDAMSISTPAPTVSEKPKRYHPALVALHWLIFILIFATAFLGLLGGEGGEGRRAGLLLPGFPTLAIHMILGVTVLVLLIIRLIVRWRAKSPDWASTGNSFLDLVGRLTHWALYFFTFMIVITGIILALQGNRLARTFGLAATTPRFTPGQLQPGQFPPNGQFQPGQTPRFGGGEGEFEGGFGRGNFFFQLGRLHGISWALFFLLIVFHAGAALYHQFFVKDNLLGRMWFGKRYG